MPILSYSHFLSGDGIPIKEAVNYLGIVISTNKHDKRFPEL